MDSRLDVIIFSTVSLDVLRSNDCPRSVKSCRKSHRQFTFTNKRRGGNYSKIGVSLIIEGGMILDKGNENLLNINKYRWDNSFSTMQSSLSSEFWSLASFGTSQALVFYVNDLELG